MCTVVEENTADLVRTSWSRKQTEVNAMKNFHQLETICGDVNRILTQQNQHTLKPIANSDNKSNVLLQNAVLDSE